MIKKLRYSLLAAGLCMPVLLYASSVMAQPGGGASTGVFVTMAKEKTIADEVEALGTLKANESVDIKSTVTELVTEIHFEDGQRVTKGDLLLNMDAAEEVAERAEERAKLQEAERQVKRLKPLTAKGASSESVLDEAEREVQSAKARLQAIQSRIDLRTVKAPFDGVLGLRNVSIGALAQPGTTITTIDDDTLMKLDFSVPDVFIENMEIGVSIEARARAFPNDVFEGKVYSIDSRIDPVTRAIVVRALIDNDDRRLKPGLLMRVTADQNPRQSIVLPEEVLIPDGEQYYIYVVRKDGDKSTAERRNVEIGVRRKGEVEILSGVQVGEKVISQGTLKVRPGGEVSVKATEMEGDTLRDLLNNGKKQPEQQEATE